MHSETGKTPRQDSMRDRPDSVSQEPAEGVNGAHRHGISDSPKPSLVERSRRCGWLSRRGDGYFALNPLLKALMALSSFFSSSLSRAFFWSSSSYTGLATPFM